MYDGLLDTSKIGAYGRSKNRAPTSVLACRFGAASRGARIGAKDLESHVGYLEPARRRSRFAFPPGGPDFGKSDPWLMVTRHVATVKAFGVAIRRRRNSDRYAATDTRIPAQTSWCI